MIKTKYDLSKILPHKNPMILLDDILNYDLENQTLEAIFKVYPEKIFFDKKNQGINSLVGIEFMAQAIGCYCFFKNNQKEPEPGLLLGTRLFNNSIDCFKNGQSYRVIIKEAYSDNEIYAFDCKIIDSQNDELQSACIKVFKGENIKEILNDR